MSRSSHFCDRARESISVELDGALSEVERAMLRRHLRECAQCAAFRSETRAFTEALRDASLEECTIVFSPIARRRRRTSQLRRVVPAAAAAMLFLSVGGTLGRVVGQREPSPPPPSTTTNVNLSSPPRVSGAFAVIEEPTRLRTPSALLGQRSASEDF